MRGRFSWPRAIWHGPSWKGLYQHQKRTVGRGATLATNGVRGRRLACGRSRYRIGQLSQVVQWKIQERNQSERTKARHNCDDKPREPVRFAFLRYLLRLVRHVIAPILGMRENKQYIEESACGVFLATAARRRAHATRRRRMFCPCVWSRNLYPTPHTVWMYSGSSGLSSILARKRLMWELTVCS